MKGAQRHLSILSGRRPEHQATNKMLLRLQAARCGQAEPGSVAVSGWAPFHASPPAPAGWGQCSRASEPKSAGSRGRGNHTYLSDGLGRFGRSVSHPPVRVLEAAVDRDNPKDDSCYSFQRKGATCSCSLIPSSMGMGWGTFPSQQGR